MIKWTVPYPKIELVTGLKIGAETDKASDEHHVATVSVLELTPGESYRVAYRTFKDAWMQSEWRITEHEIHETSFSIPLRKAEMEVFAVTYDREREEYTQLNTKLIAVSKFLAEGVEKDPGYQDPNDKPDWGLSY